MPAALSPMPAGHRIGRGARGGLDALGFSGRVGPNLAETKLAHERAQPGTEKKKPRPGPLEVLHREPASNRSQGFDTSPQRDWHASRRPPSAVTTALFPAHKPARRDEGRTRRLAAEEIGGGPGPAAFAAKRIRPMPPSPAGAA
jgi:hypothetical protein